VEERLQMALLTANPYPHSIVLVAYC